MVKKLIGVLLIVVMTVSMAACGRSSKKEPEQPKNKKYPYGFRCYYSEPPYERRLSEEYENRVNRVTDTEYEISTGEVSSRKEYLYDDDGEKLLKEVDDSYSMGIANEYDQKGRRIRSVRYWLKEPEISIPSLNIVSVDYSWANSQLLELLTFFRLSVQTTELRTEFTYEGDSEIPSSIKSFSKEGDEVMHMDLGEHGEVVYAFYEDSQLRYEETYDAVERKGMWKLYDRPVLPGESDRLTESGENYYDESGRKSRWLSYCYDYDGKAGLYSETQFTYDSNGYVVVTKRLGDNDVVSSENTKKYDTDDNLLESSYYDYTPNGEYYSASITTNTYHGNGQLASSVTEKWDSDAKKFVPDREEEYNEDGVQTAERVYIGGQLLHETVVSFLEEEGIVGPVKATLNMNYEDGKLTSRGEVYAVQVKDPYGNVDWSEYRSVVTNKWGRSTDTSRYQTTFDEEGRLIRKAVPKDGYYIKYDLQGRVLKEVMYEGTESQVTYEYEYWDENPESGKGSER